MSISATSNDPGTVASPAATTASGTNADNATNAASAASTDAASQADKLTPASAKQQLNAAILQASLDVSLTSQNDPLSLLYKSAIENLNEALKSQMGDNAIQNSAKEDNTPEATAGRIVSFISQAYEMYRGQNKDQDEATTSTNSCPSFRAASTRASRKRAAFCPASRCSTATSPAISTRPTIWCKRDWQISPPPRRHRHRQPMAAPLHQPTSRRQIRQRPPKADIACIVYFGRIRAGHEKDADQSLIPRLFSTAPHQRWPVSIITV